jgi:hypothetical protein
LGFFLGIPEVSNSRSAKLPWTEYNAWHAQPSVTASRL